MIDHDKNVGTVLKAIDDLGMADNTIVMYSTDNGPHMNSWPDARHDALPQREELELGRRLPRARDGALAGPHQAGHGQQRHCRAPRLLPTLLAAAGVPDVKEQLLKGMKVGDTTFKVHLDGYNLLPLLTGETTVSPRKEFFYFNDDRIGRPAL